MEGSASRRLKSLLVLCGVNKKAPAPHMGQEQNSCDTTQIDANASTRYTHHHACPRLITGGISRRSLLKHTALSVRPRKSIHRTAKRPLRTAADSLWNDDCRLLIFVTGFYYGLIIGRGILNVKEIFNFRKKTQLSALKRKIYLSVLIITSLPTL